MLASVRGQPRIVGPPGGGFGGAARHHGLGSRYRHAFWMLSRRYPQLVDLDFWFRFMLRLAVCLCHKNFRCALKRLARNRCVTRRPGRNWLHQLHIPTWLIVDPNVICRWMRNIGTAPLRTRNPLRRHNALAKQPIWRPPAWFTRQESGRPPQGAARLR